MRLVCSKKDEGGFGGGKWMGEESGRLKNGKRFGVKDSEEEVREVSRHQGGSLSIICILTPSFVLKDIEYVSIHSDFQNCARLATGGFRCVSRRIS
jgi:hypothetical protein